MTAQCDVDMRDEWVIFSKDKAERKYNRTRRGNDQGPRKSDFREVRLRKNMTKEMTYLLIFTKTLKCRLPSASKFYFIF